MAFFDDWETVRAKEEARTARQRTRDGLHADKANARAERHNARERAKYSSGRSDDMGDRYGKDWTSGDSNSTGDDKNPFRNPADNDKYAGRDSVAKNEARDGEENAAKFGGKDADGSSNDEANAGEGGINFTGGKGKEDKDKKKKGMLALKKFGPTAGIMTFAIMAILGGGALVGPLGQIQHIVEMLNGRYDMGGWTALRRTNLILVKKLNARVPNVDGIRAVTTNFRGSKLYYSKMSAKTISKFRNAGFDLIDDVGNVLDGTSAVGKGKTALLRRTGTDRTWTPQEFVSDYNAKPEFRADVSKVYKGRVANWLDNKIATFKSKMKLWGNAKGTKMTDADGSKPLDEAALEQQQKQSSRDVGEASDVSSGNARAPNADDYKTSEYPDGASNPDYKSALDNFNATSLADDAAKSSVSNLKRMMDALDSPVGIKVIRGIGAFLSVLGWADTACQTFLFFEEVGKVVKTDQIDQMMNAAYLFLSDADKIKAGEQTPEVVEAVGTRLNTPSSYEVLDTDSDEVRNAGGTNSDVDFEREMEKALKGGGNEDVYVQSQPKTATEAQGFKWIQFFELIPTLDGSAGKFVAGVAGFIGMMVSLSKNPGISGFCHFATHPVTRGVATVLGIGLLLIPAARGIATAAQAGAKITFTSALKIGLGAIRNQLFGHGIKAFIKGTWDAAVQFIIPLVLRLIFPHLVNLVKGEICKAIVGQDYMNCIVSGAGAMNGKGSSYGGNAVLSKDTARAAYLDFQEYVAMVAEEERLERSPFDINSKHTFLGSIVSNLWPYMNSLKSFTGIFTTLGSLTRASAFATMPSVSATSFNTFNLANFDASMDVCEDDAYEGLATDPWCNLIYGVEVGHLRNDDPDNVINTFINDFQAEVSQDTGEMSVYDYYYHAKRLDSDGVARCKSDYTWRENYTQKRWDDDGNLISEDTNIVGTCQPEPKLKTPLTYYRENCMERDVYWPIDVKENVDQRYCIIGKGYQPTNFGGIDGCDSPNDQKYVDNDKICGHPNDSRYTDDYRSLLALFYIDTRIEDNTDSTGMSQFESGTINIGNGSGNGSGSGWTGSRKLDEATTIFVGDSRTVGMCDAVVGNCPDSSPEGDNNKLVITNQYIAKVGASHSWLTATGIPELQKILDANPGKKYNIVFNGMGVNDHLSNASSYASTFNTFASAHSDHRIIVTATAPIDLAKLTASSYDQDRINNITIASFNDTLSNSLSGDNIRFCANTYTDMIGVESSYFRADGLHYEVSGSRKIYDIIINNCGGGGGVPGEVVWYSQGVWGGSGYVNAQGDNSTEWANYHWYGSNDTTIEEGGCGVAAMAMILTALTGDRITPLMVGVMATDMHYRGIASLHSNGSSHSSPEKYVDYLNNAGKGLSDTALENAMHNGKNSAFTFNSDFKSTYNAMVNAGYGLSTKELSTASQVTQALNDGWYVWTCGSDPNGSSSTGTPYTTGGHCIAIIGVSGSGNWYVGDANGNKGKGYFDNKIEFSPDRIMNRGSVFKAVGLQ